MSFSNYALPVEFSESIFPNGWHSNTGILLTRGILKKKQQQQKKRPLTPEQQKATILQGDVLVLNNGISTWIEHL